MNPKHFKNILFVYLLFIITVLIHYHLLLNEIINWHDDELFYAMYAVASGGVSLFSQHDHSPAMMLVYSLQYAIGGNGHFIYHAISLLLHTANALLLFTLLLRFGASSALAMIATLLFALHPIHVESLAMISFQSTVLSLFFLQLVVLVYSQYLERGNQIFLYLSVVLTILFYLIGNPAVYLIIAIMAVRYAMHKEITVRTMTPFISVWLIGIISVVWKGQYWSALWSVVSETIMMIRYGFIDQAIRIIIPWKSTLLVDSIQELRMDQGIISMVYPLMVIVVVSAAIVVRERIPVMFYGIMIIVVSSVPIMSGVNRGDWLFAEYGAYIASVGWVVIFSWVIDKRLEVARNKKGWRITFYSVVSIILLVFSIQTAVKSSYWENGKTYWDKCLEEKPENIFALMKKGMYHYFQYEIDPSLKALDAAISLAPKNYEAHYSRGVVNLGAMFLPAATIDYNNALALDPTSSNAYFGLGSIHSLYSRYDSAVIAYSEAIRYAPNFYEAYTNRGTVYGSMGKFVQSYSDFKHAQQINPTFGQLYGNRALISLQAGNAMSAAGDFAAQIALEPKQVNARIHAAFTAILLSDTSTALLQFSKAQEIDSLRTKLYLASAFETFLKSKKDVALGNTVLERVFGK